MIRAWIESFENFISNMCTYILHKMFEHLGESSKHSAQLRPIDVYSIKIASNVKIFFLIYFVLPKCMVLPLSLCSLLDFHFFFSCLTVLGYDQIKQNYNVYICSLAFEAWTQELTFLPIIVGRGCAILVRVHWPLWLL